MAKAAAEEKQEETQDAATMTIYPIGLPYGSKMHSDQIDPNTKGSHYKAGNGEPLVISKEAGEAAIADDRATADEATAATVTRAIDKAYHEAVGRRQKEQATEDAEEDE